VVGGKQQLCLWGGCGDCIIADAAFGGVGIVAAVKGQTADVRGPFRTVPWSGCNGVSFATCIVSGSFCFWLAVEISIKKMQHLLVRSAEFLGRDVNCLMSAATLRA
jgi:hypothetical protein